MPGLPGQRGVEDSSDEKAVVHSPRARRYRGCLGPDLQGRRPSVSQAGPRAVHAAPRARPAAPANRRWGRSIVPPTRKSISTCAFYDDLKRRFRAPGDFAQAYVIAHEIGHHVQTLLGIADRVQALKQNARSESQANQLQVRMELQADCFAGVWASLNHQMKNRLQPGDIESGLDRRGRHRRRPPAEADTGLRRAGVVHARQLGAARALVQARAGHRPDAGLRHVQRTESIGDRIANCRRAQRLASAMQVEPGGPAVSVP